jgi:glycosyltransferase involved in cell wall biosynthesis
MSPAAPLISAIICTYNPRRDLLLKVMESLARQTLPRDRFEIVMVDNNSSPPLHAEDWNLSGQLSVRIVSESRQGKVFAYDCAVNAARCELICMIDDDNVLDDDYLQHAVDIAQSNPQLGAFSGITRGKYERPLASWKEPLMGFLGVRDYGPDPICSGEDKWGQWEPIGAGMILRRDVGLQYIQLLHSSPHALRLDRSGSSGLLSGGDSLLARSAYRVGRQCSYQPSLKLDHHIKGSRLGTRYLMRLMLGHGRSVVILDRALNKPVKPLSVSELFARLVYRLGKFRRGWVWWCWDVGYFLESRSK